MRLVHAPMCTLAFLAACGGGDPIVPLVALAPGCPTPAFTPLPRPAGSDPDEQRASATRQMWDFALFNAFATGKALTDPVREDPTAESWEWRLDADDANGTVSGLADGVAFAGTSRDIHNRGESRIEGEVLTRGEHWAVLQMVATWTIDDELSGVDATITVTPRRTAFDFGTEVLDLREHVYRYGDYAAGCDPDIGRRFEVVPGFEDGAPTTVTRCWPAPIVVTDDAELEAEVRTSFDLQCRQTVAKMLIDG